MELLLFLTWALGSFAYAAVCMSKREVNFKSFLLTAAEILFAPIFAAIREYNR